MEQFLLRTELGPQRPRSASTNSSQKADDLIDVNEIRDREIALHGLANADVAYTIYHDETNNIRRLHVRSDGLNVREPKCFVLGGIAHRGGPHALPVEDLRVALRIQKNAPEIKLKHVATGEFLDLLNAPRLETFLDWLDRRGLFIHYSVLDPLYWSIVDIVDSILTEYGQPKLFGLNIELKSDLYTILRHDYDGTVDLFQRYTYPDVGQERRAAFVAELLDLLELRRDLLDHVNYMMLKGVLEIAARIDALPYLEDETPNVLIDGFAPFYMQRICLFKNSDLILDVEDVVKHYLSGKRFADGDRELHHFRFALSHDETGIQLADVVTGLLGKFFSLICATDVTELADMRRGLNAQQKRTLKALSGLLDRSIAENKAFAHYVLSLEDQRKAGFFLDAPL